MEAISFSHFGMTFGSGFGLKDIDLVVNAGDFVVLTGGTGSGKSTLLRQLRREFVAKDYTGSVRVHGVEVRDMTTRDGIGVGYVMQFPREQIVTDKVYHELSFGLENMGLSRDEIRLRVSETANYFGIEDYMDRCTYHLSGGEMQIVNLASVMAMHPDILLLDEPTSQLDTVTAEKFLSLVYRINRELGTTVVIAEHRLDMLEHYDSMIIMENGAIAYHGAMPEGYAELPIYTRVGEVLGEKIGSVAECRACIREKIKDKNYISNADNTKPEHGEKVITMRGVWHRYTKDSSDVLRGVDLDVYKGEILGIVGGNGAGKSTLLSLMADAMPHYRGKIDRHGAKVRYIMQNIVYLEDSVEDEIDGMIRHYVRAYEKGEKKSRRTPEEIRTYRRTLAEMKEEYLELFDLKKVLTCMPNQISGGEKAKLALMVGLLSTPDVLLLDEPTKGLDSQGKRLMAKMLGEVKNLGVSVVIVSHDIEMLGEVSDRIATLFGGEIISTCTPRELIGANYLFTTTSARITRGIVDGVTSEYDLLELARTLKG